MLRWFQMWPVELLQAGFCAWRGMVQTYSPSPSPGFGRFATDTQIFVVGSDILELRSGSQVCSLP